MVEETGSSAADTADVVVDDAAEVADGPTVDVLEARLAEVQNAMEQIQSGNLDGAEATIEALEMSLDEGPKGPGLT